MTTAEAVKELQKEHDLIANERDLDGSQLAPALLEALAMAIEVMSGKDTNVPSKDCRWRMVSMDCTPFCSNDKPPVYAITDYFGCIYGKRKGADNG